MFQWNAIIYDSIPSLSKIAPSKLAGCLIIIIIKNKIKSNKNL